MKQLTLLTILGLLAFSANAQKIGHIDIQQIIQAMPEYSLFQDSIENEYNKAQGTLAKMVKQYENLSQVYKDSSIHWSTFDQKDKLTAINALKVRIDEYQTYVSTDLNQKQSEFEQNLFERIRSAAEAVAKEKGYSYILNYTEQNLVIIYTDNSNDVTAEVKKKMGLL